MELLPVLLGKTAAFFFQNRVGKILKLIAQAFARLAQQGQFLFRSKAFLFDLRCQTFVFNRQTLCLFLQIDMRLPQPLRLCLFFLQMGNLFFGCGKTVADIGKVVLHVADSLAAFFQIGFDSLADLAFQRILVGKCLPLLSELRCQTFVFNRQTLCLFLQIDIRLLQPNRFRLFFLQISNLLFGCGKTIAQSIIFVLQMLVFPIQNGQFRCNFCVCLFNKITSCRLFRQLRVQYG